MAVFWLVHGMRAVDQLLVWSAHALYRRSVDSVTGAYRLLCFREEFTKQTVCFNDIAGFQAMQDNLHLGGLFLYHPPPTFAGLWLWKETK